MTALELSPKSHAFPDCVLADKGADYLIRSDSIEQKVILLILRDLLRLGWQVEFKTGQISVTPPAEYDKSVIRESMRFKRDEAIHRNQSWINRHMALARQNLADGDEVWHSDIDPVIELCRTQQQLDTFRVFRYYWSSPYSEYVGRRMKLIIRDSALPSRPVIGIAALGSSIVHIPDRDRWIGWDKVSRTENLIYTMDAYVLGALPPYNQLLGGKLISYVIASNEVRALYREKYVNAVTDRRKRKASELACIFTTSLYGKGSQYNRVSFNGESLYVFVGHTKGYGTLHLTDETFEAMRGLLRTKGILVTNRFGDGPIWRMRVIRTAADLLGFDSDFLLRHSFQRALYVTPLAVNYREFLMGTDNTLDYYDYALGSLVEHWRTRWLRNRRERAEIEQAVKAFRKSDFMIE